MNERASRKDGADEGLPQGSGEDPGISEGEELELGPVEGEEIDPLPKWWNEPLDAETTENDTTDSGSPGVADEASAPDAGGSEVSEEVPDLPASAPEEEGASLPAQADEEAENEPLAIVEIAKKGGADETSPGEPSALSKEEARDGKLEVGESPATEAQPAPTEKAETSLSAGSDSKTSPPESADSAKGEPGLPEPGRRRGCWTIFSTAYFFATLILGFVLIGGGFYAFSSRTGLLGKAASQWTDELAQRGIHLEHSGARYELSRGIVFEELTLYEDAAKTRPVLRAGAVGVSIDLAALAGAEGRSDSAGLSLRDSTLALFSEGEALLELEGVEGEVSLESETLQVDRLTARTGGLLLRLEGPLRLSGGGGGPGPGESGNSADGAPAPAGLDFAGLAALVRGLDIEAGESSQSELPELRLAFSADAGSVSGTLLSGPASWRGLSLDGLQLAFELDSASRALRVSSLRAVRGEGSLSAAFSIDPASRILEIGRLQSSVDPFALAAALDPQWGGRFGAIRLLDAPWLELAGTFPLDDPGSSDFVLRYAHRKGLVLELPREGDGEAGTRSLPLADLRGTFTYREGILESNDAAASLFGGHFRLNGAMNFEREGRPFNGLAEIVDLSLEKAAPWLGEKASGLGGRLTFSFRGSARQSLDSLNGGGRLRIDGAGLAAFPAVGVTQRFLGRVVPAFGGKASGTLEGAYILESGTLVTSDLTLSHDGVRLVANGSVDLAAATSRFVATVDLEPPLAAATGLAGKAVVVDGKGALDEPSLKLTAFPVEFARASLGEILGTTPESLASLRSLVQPDEAARVLLGAREDGAMEGVDPAVVSVLSQLLGPAEPPSEPAPLLRAVPQSGN